MSLHPSTMPGVLIDESDDAARAFGQRLAQQAREGNLHLPANRLPTQAEILSTARWLHMDPYEVAFNNDVLFHELEPGDLSEEDQLRYPPPKSTGDRITYWMVVGVAAAITIAAVAGGLGYIYQRWFA